MKNNQNELKQASFRVLFTAFIFCYLYFTNASSLSMIFISTYFTVGVVSAAFLLFYKKPTPYFKWVTLVADISATSFGLYLTGDTGGIYLGV